MLALLAFLFPLAFVNVALMLVYLPQAIRMITGYESVFSLSGTYLVWTPVFACLTLACTWLAFDPLIQAAYCLSCFEAESEETGEDLRVALRRIRGSVAVAILVCTACLILASQQLRADTAVSTRDLASAIRQTAQSPAYDWSRLPAPRPVDPDSWVFRVVRRVWDACSGAFETVGDAVRRFFQWLFQIRQPSPTQKGVPPPAHAVPLSVYLLIALTIVAGGLAAWRLRYATEPLIGDSPPTAGARGLAADPHDLNPLALPEQEWFELAEGYLGEEDWRMAVRALYLASLAWLGRRQFIGIRSGKTNRQYERELSRKTDDAPAAQTLFSANVRVFESAWYGMHELNAADAQRFRVAVDQMMLSLEGAR